MLIRNKVKNHRNEYIKNKKVLYQMQGKTEAKHSMGGGGGGNIEVNFNPV